MMVDLTKKELMYVKSSLFWSGRVYRDKKLPHDVNLWEPWKEVMWDKVNNALNTM